ncbi:LEA type 2 family protein [Flavihumibacter sp. R14]|nr:LEA type 2 family protein [Flavihumibacter soli]
MRRFINLCLISLFFVNCGINKQAKQLQTLEDCIYEIRSADSIYVAGRDVSKMINNNAINISNMPEFAWAYLKKDIPLKARINLKIKNPTKQIAAINRFEYLVLIKGQQLANGLVDQKVSVAPGDSLTVPVSINANIYQIVSNGKTMKEIVEFMQGGNDSASEKKGIVTLKIKPSIAIGDNLVNYPGYITIEKEVSSKILF